MPVTADGQLVLAGVRAPASPGQCQVVALSAADGTERWRSAAIDGDAIYLSDALGPATGRTPADDILEWEVQRDQAFERKEAVRASIDDARASIDDARARIDELHERISSLEQSCSEQDSLYQQAARKVDELKALHS